MQLERVLPLGHKGPRMGRALDQTSPTNVSRPNHHIPTIHTSKHTMKPRFQGILALTAVTVFAALVPAGAAISIVDSYSQKLAQQGGTMSFTINTGDFDPGGADKLVLLTGSRGSGGSTWGKSWNSATWGTTPLVTAVSLRSGDTSPTAGGEEVAAISYLDNPTTETSLTIVFNGKMDTEGWFTLLALSGTEDGVGATSGSVVGGPNPLTPVSSGGTSLTTTAANSLVVAGSAADRTTITPQSPLTTLVSPGGDNFATGYEFVATPGAVTPTFAYSADKYSPIVVAAEFVAIPEPASSVLLIALGGLGLLRRRM
jgi:hypothetical protein